MQRMGFCLGGSLRVLLCFVARKDEGNENKVEMLSTNEDGGEGKER